VRTRLPFLLTEPSPQIFNGYFGGVIPEFIFESSDAIPIELLSLIVGLAISQRVVRNFGKTHYSASQLLWKLLPF